MKLGGLITKHSLDLVLFLAIGLPLLGLRDLSPLRPLLRFLFVNLLAIQIP